MTARKVRATPKPKRGRPVLIVGGIEGELRVRAGARHRAALDRAGEALGLRSHAEVVRALIERSEWWPEHARDGR